MGKILRNVLFITFGFASTTQAEVRKFRLERLVNGLDRPVKLSVAPGNPEQIYIVEQAGRILVYEGKKLKKEPILDIKDRVFSRSSETGLLGLAFHPEFKNNGRLFVNYTGGSFADLYTRISEFKFKDGKIDKKSEEVILTFNQPYTNHNGGEVAFGLDGMLYIGTGDGGSRDDPKGNGQNLETLLGKILRIDVNASKPYAIPKDNPTFAKNPNAKKEIYAYGLRNPWRFSFDKTTHQLWVGDVGQDTREEINIVKAGGNYGWNVMEGFLCFSPKKNCHQDGLEKPIIDYSRDKGVSVTGGFVYRGKALPRLVGTYVYGDYGSGLIWGLKQDKSGKVDNQLLMKSKKSISSFGEDAQNELYVLDLGGEVLKIIP